MLRHHPLQPPLPGQVPAPVTQAQPAAARRKRRRACVACKAAHAACDRGMPCNRCVNLGKAAECRESVPLSSSSSSTSSSSSSTSTSSTSTSTSSSSASSASSAYQPPPKRQKVAPAFISPAPGPGGAAATTATATPFHHMGPSLVPATAGPGAIPVGHLAGFPPGAFLRPLPLASFFAQPPQQPATTTTATLPTAAAAWAAAEERESGREREREQREREKEMERAQRAQALREREKEREDRDRESEHKLLEKQIEHERQVNSLVVGLLNEIKLLKTTTRQLRGESEHLRKQIAALQVERKNSPPSEQLAPAFDRPLLISSNSAASWIPYSNPSQPRTMPPVISSVFPPMSEANVGFVVDDDNKPFCLIKRQPLADDRVAIMHSLNAAWSKVLLYTSEELMGQSIRKVVEDASLRESRNRINSFHAQQAAAASKGRSCSPCLHLQPRFIRKDGTTFDALVRQQFFYDAATREPLWSVLCIDGIRDSRRISPCSSPDPQRGSSPPSSRSSSSSSFSAAGAAVHQQQSLSFDTSPRQPIPTVAPSSRSSPSASAANGTGGSGRGHSPHDDYGAQSEVNTNDSAGPPSMPPSRDAERYVYRDTTAEHARVDRDDGLDARRATTYDGGGEAQHRASDAKQTNANHNGGGNGSDARENSDGVGGNGGWSSLVTATDGGGSGGQLSHHHHQPQGLQPRNPPPLSPATLELLNSLNNIQSWP